MQNRYFGVPSVLGHGAWDFEIGQEGLACSKCKRRKKKTFSWIEDNSDDEMGCSSCKKKKKKPDLTLSRLEPSGMMGQRRSIGDAGSGKNLALVAGVLAVGGLFYALLK